MTTPARPVRCDIPALHAAIAPVWTLQQERRALYQLATELLDGSRPPVLDPDVIDSPIARNSIGDALAGQASLTRSALVGISAMADAGSRVQQLPVVSHPQANTVLARALNTIGAELRRQQPTSNPPGLLTEADGKRFSSALAVLRDGVALARSTSPELVDDLLAHVALLGIIDPQRAGRLASASPRAFPGLVLLKSPQSGIEVAEALAHEGAHQKLFDLAITHDLLNADSDLCPPYHPPWAPQGRLWPLEQTLAACHAYVCLAQFAQDVGITAGVPLIGTDSLLPVASERSAIIGEWLLDKGDYLGTDALTLLDGLLGQRPRTAGTVKSSSAPVVMEYIVARGLEFRRCSSSNRVLVGRPTSPPQLYWVSDDAATALEHLAQKSLGEVTESFALRWRIPHVDATDRLAALLSDLYSSGLVTTRY